MANSIQKVSFREKVGYSLGDGAANLVFQMMMMFQMMFYTDVFGIKATVAGNIILLARLFDACIDPVVGGLSDRTKTRWGKYRPWILWTAIPFAVFFVLAFTTPDFGERGKIIYAGVTYILLMAVYSFCNTPYSSLGGVMTGDVKERTSITTIRFVTATIATFVVQGLTLPMVTKLGNGQTSDSKGWFWTILIFAILSIVLLVITFFSTKERIEPSKTQKTSWKLDIKDVLKSRPWLSMFIFTLFLFTTLSMFGNGMSYYFNNVVDKQALYEFLGKFGLIANESSTSIVHGALDAFGLIAQPDMSNVFAVGYSFFNMIGSLLQLAAVIILSQWLAGLFGKRNVFLVCMTLTTAFTAMFYFVSPTNISGIFWINIGKNLSYAPTVPLLWAMMADVADHSEWVNHRRATGLVFAGIVFALKAGLGVGGFICGRILNGFGYVEADIVDGVKEIIVQSPQAIEGIRLCASLIPASTFFIGVIALIFYPLTKKLTYQIQDELQLRRDKEAAQN